MGQIKSLLETIREVKGVELQHPNKLILYKVYERDSLIYIGIGGKGKRKPSGRIMEHYKSTMPSSFKWKILEREWLKGKTREDAETTWNSLVWDYELGDKDYIETKEQELIKKYQPPYNIEFK